MFDVLHRITESQNHRMFRGGRDLCVSSCPIPLPKQGHLQQAVQDNSSITKFIYNSYIKSLLKKTVL